MREIVMYLKATALIAVAAAAPIASAVGQTPPAPAGRTVVAATKLPSVTDKPLRFKALSFEISPGAKENFSTTNGMLYQVSGTLEVSTGSETKMLMPGQGVYIAAAKSVSMQGGSGERSTSIYFLLVPDGDADQPQTAAFAKELYHTPAPIPGLKPGPYELNLTRVTFPAHMPSNAPHHRSGAALYYVISGAGANTIEGKTEERKPGAFIYEPTTLVHQWGNPGDVPLTFLTFNMNQEGVPAVVSDAPPKAP
jgi:quercetin dioxygenase-like cupin family protein